VRQIIAAAELFFDGMIQIIMKNTGKPITTNLLKETTIDQLSQITSSENSISEIGSLLTRMEQGRIKAVEYYKNNPDAPPLEDFE